MKKNGIETLMAKNTNAVEEGERRMGTMMKKVRRIIARIKELTKLREYHAAQMIAIGLEPF